MSKKLIVYILYCIVSLDSCLSMGFFQLLTAYCTEDGNLLVQWTRSLGYFYGSQPLTALSKTERKVHFSF
jgi:hypothetical protein